MHSKGFDPPRLGPTYIDNKIRATWGHYFILFFLAPQPRGLESKKEPAYTHEGSPHKREKKTERSPHKREEVTYPEFEPRTVK